MTKDSIEINLSKIAGQITRHVVEQYEKAQMDALAYGVGYLRVTPDGEMRHISAKEVIEQSAFILENKRD